MKEKSLKEQISEAISQMPQQLVIVENSIEPALLKEYFDSSCSFGALRVKVPPDKITLMTEHLFDTETLLDERKRILVVLAHDQTVESYRSIERFVNSEQEGLLKTWGRLALQEARMFLESELLDESHGFILSGLGGKGNKLRYFMALVAAIPNSLTTYQHQIVDLEIQTACREFDAELENVNFNMDYVSYTALIPLDVPVGDMIEIVIERCNELGDFLSPDYLITNIEIIPDEQIAEIIVDMRQNETDNEGS